MGLAAGQVLAPGLYWLRFAPGGKQLERGRYRGFTEGDAARADSRRLLMQPGVALMNSAG